MRVGFIGSGNMATALARGWGDPVLATDAGSGRAAKLAQELGGEAVSSNRELAEKADMVILAHKPYQLEQVAREADGAARVVVSILARVTQAEVRAQYPGAQVFCVEPNVPVELRQGVLAFAEPDAEVDERLYAELRELFGRLGTVVEVPERLLAVAGVASPGGTTARGLRALERGGVRAALAAAMDDVLGA